MKTETYLGVKIDTNRDEILSEQAEKLLTEYYCRPDETSPQMAFARAANAYSYGDKVTSDTRGTRVVVDPHLCGADL